MIFTERTSIVLVGAALAFILGAYMPALIFAGWVLLLLLVAGLLIELRSFPVRSSFSVNRSYPKKMTVGVRNTVVLEIQSRSTRSWFIRIHDEPPDIWQMREVNFQDTLPPHRALRWMYDVYPMHRGVFSFYTTTIEVKGIFFDLVRKRYAFPSEQTVQVYPDFRTHTQPALLSVNKRNILTSQRSVRRYGAGTEFESLREYTPDDEYRKINWSASARSGKWMANQFQMERAQHIMLLIDTGRLMGSEAFGLSKLDHAVNAAARMTQVCIAHGDAVGLMLFGSAVHSFLLPKKNTSQRALIAESLYTARLERTESDYTTAFQWLQRRQRHRALVLVFTEIVDRYSSQILLGSMASLYPKHLPVFILMKDKALTEVLQRPVMHSDSAFEKGVTAELLREREEAIAFARSRGALVIDAMPDHFHSAVINLYLDIKARGRL